MTREDPGTGYSRLMFRPDKKDIHTQVRRAIYMVEDVAKLAGVSTATVSRVVNGTCTVSRETRERVLLAVSQLRYRPNKHAAALGRANGGVPKRRPKTNTPVRNPREGKAKSKE